MKKYLLLSLLIFCIDIASADVIVEKSKGSVFFGDKVEYFEDQDNLSFHEILKQKTGWKSSELKSLSFGVTKSAIWLRFDLENKTNHDLFMNFNVINNDYINLYILDENGTYTEKTGGSCYPFNHREIYDKDIFFVIPEKKGVKTIYARFVSGYLLVMAPEVVTRSETFKRSIKTYTPYSVYYGILLALLIYNFFIFISSWDKSYLILVLLIFSFGLYDIAQDGFGFMFFWPDSVYFENMVIPLAIGLMGITTALFVLSSVENIKKYKLVYYVIYSCVIGGAILSILSFLLGKPVCIAITLLFVAQSSTFTLFCLFYLGIVKKDRTSFIMFVAFIILETGNLFALATSNSSLVQHIPFLNNYLLTLAVLKFGRTWFIIIYSFVLADKINIMKKSIEMSRETYKSIFNGTNEAFIILDNETYTLVDCNTRLLSMLNLNKEDIIGKTSGVTSSAEDGCTEDKAFDLIKQMETDNTALIEWCFKKPDGNKLWAEIALNKVTLNGINRILGVIRDISKRRKNEEEKEKLTQQLAQAQKMEAVGSLAGGLAHDFNNILTGILGSSSIAETYLYHNEVDKDKIAKYLNIIKEASLKAAGTVNQLLTMTRKQELKFVQANLNVILKNVVDICLNSFPKSVVIETDYLDTPAKVKADITGIDQAFLNIFVNASHAVTIMRNTTEPEGGIISLKISEQYADDTFCRLNKEAVQGRKYFLVAVQDNGIGIDDDTLEKIFDPFFTEKKEPKGTGLGLSMVYTIIKQHNGFIKVYSEKGAGTNFIIHLPEDTDNTISKIENENANAIVKWHGKILVIDDEKYVREIAFDTLTESGYHVVTSSSGSEGIEIYKKNADDIDLVLLDISMPGLSGLDTFKEIKKINQSAKIILSSGFGMDERVRKTLELGADSFIQKPYTDKKLSKTVYEVLVNKAVLR